MSMRKYNCVSYALRLEDDDNILPVQNLDYHLEPVDAVMKYARSYGLQCRTLESSSSPLEDGEWAIVFWGFIIDYDPEDYGSFFCFPDFHFARKCEDGIWKERLSWGAPVEEINIQEKIDLFLSKAYKPYFFAVKKQS